MPPWLLLTVMALTVYRATRLLTTDDFPPLLWVRDRICGGWRPLTQQEIDRYAAAVADGHTSLGWALGHQGDKTVRYLTRASWSPYWLAKLMSCAWCASGWVAGLVTLAVDLTVGIPAPWLVGPAVWAAGALLASRNWA